MTGNIFKGHLQDALFNAAAIISGQGIQLLGMLTEAIHTPFMQDRFLAIQNARYIFNNMRHFGEDIMIKPDGIMASRAKSVLQDAHDMLLEIESDGLLHAIAHGKFAAVKRPMEGGKGRDGQLRKDPEYYNPFMTIMKKN
jgi:beta-lysine 5,6-aminomutase alpha subunit